MNLDCDASQNTFRQVEHHWIMQGSAQSELWFFVSWCFDLGTMIYVALFITFEKDCSCITFDFRMRLHQSLFFPLTFTSQNKMQLPSTGGFQSMLVTTHETQVNWLYPEVKSTVDEFTKLVGHETTVLFQSVRLSVY